ncbi:unnamed protein product, partial [Dovyalis caffra]
MSPLVDMPQHRLIKILIFARIILVKLLPTSMNTRSESIDKSLMSDIFFNIVRMMGGEKGEEGTRATKD